MNNILEKGGKNPYAFEIGSIKSLAIAGGKALFIRHVCSFSINFLGGVILARFLGPEILGLYFISYTVFVIFRQIIDFGGSIQIIRLPITPSLTEIKTTYTLQQIIGIIGCVVIIYFSPFISNWYKHKELFPLLISAAIGGYFYSWQCVPLAQLERNMHYRKVGLIEVSEIFVFNLTAVIGTLIDMGIWGLVLGNIFRGFWPALLSISLTGLWPSFIKDRQKIFSQIVICSDVVGSHLVIWLVLLAPPVLVGFLAGAKELGIAQLSYNFLYTTMFISTIIQRIGLSALAKLQDDKESFNNAIQQILQLLSVIYIPLVMIVSSFSPWWVPVIYGKEWSKMDEVILIGAMPITISALLLIFQSVFFSKGLASLVFKQNLVHAILYWGVMALLVSSWGGVSVPISHLIAMSAGYLFIKGYSKHCGELNYKPIVSGFTMGVLIMILSWFLLREGDFWLPVVLWGAFLFFLFFTPFFQGKQMAMKMFNSLRKGTL